MGLQSERGIAVSGAAKWSRDLGAAVSGAAERSRDSSEWDCRVDTKKVAAVSGAA